MTPNITLDPGAATLLAQLHAAGYKAYAVGGCVRDSLLGKAPADWDLCTSARPEQVLLLFGEERCIPTGLKHGTVTVRQGESFYEITTFRVEGAYSDGRHPDKVDFVADVTQDLARRDFTINAMAYNEKEGLVDPFGGRADLAARQVRAVGDPARRFAEDSLRILRLYRFGAREEFSLDPATRAAALVLRDGLKKISAERILQEVSKLLLASRPGRWLEPALMEIIFPALDPLGQPGRFAACCAVIDAAPADLILRFAALLGSLGREGAGQALRSLRPSNELLKQVSELAAEWDFTPADSPAARRVQARHLLARLSPQQTARLAALGRARTGGPEWDALGETLETLTAENACCRIGQLAIGGQELQALGFGPGRTLGQALAALLEQVLDEKIPNEKAALLTAARALLAHTQEERQDTTP